MKPKPSRMEHVAGWWQILTPFVISLIIGLVVLNQILAWWRPNVDIILGFCAVTLFIGDFALALKYGVVLTECCK